MKGIVFTEFLEMVESKFGYETVDHLLTENDLASGGVYTAVGTYEFSEMLQLVVGLHKKTELPIPVLLNTFGQYLFGTFYKAYPQFFNNCTNAFDFLESIEKYIHVEVRKLYPDAELPKFKTKRIKDNQLEMIYQSERRMGDFAEGLIQKTLEHYQLKANIEKENITPDGSEVRFLIHAI